MQSRLVGSDFEHYAILLDQIMDDMLLMFVHPTGQGDDQKGKRVQERAHCRKLSRRLSSLTPQCFQSI